MLETSKLVASYRTKGILVDTNLMLLYGIGSLDPKHVTSFKRTAQYSVEDFELLKLLLAGFSNVVTTPNILTEVNSLSGQLAEQVKREYLTMFSAQIRAFLEEYVASAAAADRAIFQKVGLADTTIALSARGKYLVLTDDWKLSRILAHEGIDVLNFNHIRFDTW
jgi:rRNA-processing protein FCF1